MAHIASLNLGSIREIVYRGRPRTTAIFKEPTSERRAVHRLGLSGDAQADLQVHGGEFKAVYLYSAEDEAWWSAELGRPIPPGTFGENLTTTGLDINAALLGEQWRIGSALVELTQPRFPCWKLGFRMGDPKFPRRFLDAGRPGTYVKVIEEGEIGPGDTIEAVSRPDHAISVGLIGYLNGADRQLAVLLLEAVAAGAPLEVLNEVLAGLVAAEAEAPGEVSA